uniref:3-dehydroquinate synthase n=1 Tax=Candidatus Kentrum sp. FW TaxID=2126338 RepID=A0A450SKM9_9GAMM|nr:MAG: 3-dehydroquinate synthase [Candidatus Kentron sp. FW]
MKEYSVQTFNFHIGDQKIPCHIGYDCIEELIEVIEGFQFDMLMVGFDEHSYYHHGEWLLSALKKADIPHFNCMIPAGETNKTWKTLDYILSTLILGECTRSTMVLAFGGGMVDNIFGMAAGLLYRGIRLIYFPTTFLSAHDSVTSQKQAVNHSGYKNIVGLYHPPSAIICDTRVMSTIGSHNIKSGLAELVKNGIIFGGEFHDAIDEKLTTNRELDFSGGSLAKLIGLGIKAKQEIVKHDPREKTISVILEYGHTIGHAIELTCPDGEMTHGEAIAIGMLAASFIANKMHLMTDADRKKHDELIEKLDLQLPLLHDAAFNKIWERVHKDNKRGYIPERKGFVPMVLLKKIGEPHRRNVQGMEYAPEAIVEDAIHFVLSKFQPKPTPLMAS